MKISYPVSKPDLTGNEIAYITKTIKEGWVSSKSPVVEEFEKEFAKYHGMQYGVTASSGTTALILALRALKIGKGDEVIISNFTMIASAWAVTFVGATPVFVDCDDRMLIDTSLIEEKITEHTKAIMAVHIYGRQCDMEKINKIAYDYNLDVIEDSCEALGMKPQSDIACFSLYANKIITSGEGGICVTNNLKFAEQMRHIGNMSFDKTHNFYHANIAYNFRMSGLQAAIAKAQLEKIDKFLEKRRKIEQWYDTFLQNIPQITILPQRNIVWFYDCLAIYRAKLMEYLKKEGIETRMFFKPMNIQPMYREKEEKSKALFFSNMGLYFPTYTQIQESDVQYICDKIKLFYGQK